MIGSMCLEIEMRKQYLDQSIINTIYFGGGTPSFLSQTDIKRLVETLYKNFDISPELEFTFECNPDDITPEFLSFLKDIQVNRLSIGIQSFDADQLTFMNRAHTANEGITAVELAKSYGFDNITIDLIYGLPNTDQRYWQSQINQAVELDVNHISAYCLTIEPQTAFGNWYKKGKLIPLNDQKSAEQFNQLVDQLRLAGFEQYEISNFARHNQISRHNSAYWLGQKYLGIGPSAHSYNGLTRQWNVSHNLKYIKAIQAKQNYFEIETLSIENQFNEYILTRLRTKWGVDLNDLKTLSETHYKRIENTIKKFLNSKDLTINSNTLYLTEKGKLMADYISSELFV